MFLILIPVIANLIVYSDLSNLPHRIFQCVIWMNHVQHELLTQNALFLSFVLLFCFFTDNLFLKFKKKIRICVPLICQLNLFMQCECVGVSHTVAKSEKQKYPNVCSRCRPSSHAPLKCQMRHIQLQRYTCVMCPHRRRRLRLRLKRFCHLIFSCDFLFAFHSHSVSSRIAETIKRSCGVSIEFERRTTSEHSHAHKTIYRNIQSLRFSMVFFK